MVLGFGKERDTIHRKRAGSRMLLLSLLLRRRSGRAISTNLHWWCIGSLDVAAVAAPTAGKRVVAIPLQISQEGILFRLPLLFALFQIGNVFCRHVFLLGCHLALQVFHHPLYGVPTSLFASVILRQTRNFREGFLQIFVQIFLGSSKVFLELGEAFFVLFLDFLDMGFVLFVELLRKLFEFRLALRVLLLGHFLQGVRVLAFQLPNLCISIRLDASQFSLVATYQMGAFGRIPKTGHSVGNR
mmetsp:Transcript_6503/g.13461  ORF Transcript_6503/g.13461 Transcript_6503/m.13461 type:complete len:243 (+) Transcript_6503:354-1082(+)